MYVSNMIRSLRQFYRCGQTVSPGEKRNSMQQTQKCYLFNEAVSLFLDLSAAVAMNFEIGFKCLVLLQQTL